ncbi:Peroxiredoxin-4 [Balamuthia mandrillaris]
MEVVPSERKRKRNIDEDDESAVAALRSDHPVVEEDKKKTRTFDVQSAKAERRLVAVGKPAPFFEADAVLGEEFTAIRLSDFRGKYLVLFFYPLDFTFVCPTEILAFSDRIDEFRQLNCQVVGVSVDSKYSHLAWINTPRQHGGLGGELAFPLASDLTHSISRNYGVYLEEAGHSLRGLFIINREGQVMHITMNAPPVGRNVDETLRLVQAFQYAEEHGEVCPANWTPGKATIKPDPQSSKAFFSSLSS